MRSRCKWTNVGYAAARKDTVGFGHTCLAPLRCRAGNALDIVVEACDDVAADCVLEVLGLFRRDGLFARVLCRLLVLGTLSLPAQSMRPRPTSCRSSALRFCSKSFKCCRDLS